MKKYYNAYEERYKKAHEEGMLWFSNEPTPEVLDWVKFNNIKFEEEICEIGCGEGRDARHLAKNGYSITGVDISKAAITKCKELSGKQGISVNWITNDALFIGDEISKRFKFIYSVATLHMLVDSKDRKVFLKSLFNILEPEGKLLLVNMGDGVTERESDIANAFELQERNHMATGKKIKVAATSYRGVNFENHKREITEAGFIIEKAMVTENSEYDKCMTMYLTKD